MSSPVINNVYDAKVSLESESISLIRNSDCKNLSSDELSDIVNRMVKRSKLSEYFTFQSILSKDENNVDLIFTDIFDNEVFVTVMI